VIDQYLELSTTSTKPILVPYKGGGPAVQAVMGNHIDVIMVPLQIVKTQIDAGKLRLLALSNTVAEFPTTTVLSDKYKSWKDYDSYIIVAPDNLNSTALNYWSGILKQYLEDPNTTKYLVDEYSIPLVFGVRDAETSIANSITKVSIE
jgi:tripartite-type tricarboxylate transporter receptor subunit TctC